MEKKIVFLDIDGTIYNDDKKIPVSTIEAVKALKAKNIKVVIATGRAYFLALDAAKALDIDTLITFNGAFVLDKEKEIYKDSFDKKTLVTLYELSDVLQTGTTFYAKHNTYKNHHGSEHIKQNHTLHQLGDVFETSAPWDHEVYGICLYATKEIEKIYQEKFQNLTFYRWEETICELTQKHISKATGIEKLLNYYNIKPEEAIAFGDGANDLEMLSYVGLGISMGNGKTELKKVADYVTSSVDEDGIMRALKHFSII
jgi:Cof subfamily protein (haloacid dehalogenase superfamily)